MRPKKISDEDILEVARQCLIEQGSGVSTQFIADRLEVSQATLFKRFGTKLKLLQAALSLPIKAKFLLERIEVLPSDDPVKEQLLTLCLDMLVFFDEMIPCWATLHAAGISFPEHLSEDAPPIRLRKGLTRWIAHLQDQDRIRQQVEPESIALALLGALQHRPFRNHIIKDQSMTQSDSEYVESIVDVMWRGLIPQEKT